jgi:hypothetical protein
MHQGDGSSSPSLGFWAEAVWYFAPHASLEVDGIFRQTAHPGQADTGSLTILLQAHVFL